MLPPYLTPTLLKSFVDLALTEDIGEGDHSTNGSVPAQAIGEGRLLVKDNGLLAGVELAGYIFNQYDPGLQVDFLKKDGDEVAKGEIAFVVSGKARSILTTERLVLNCMQRMSGIATYTKGLSKLIEGTKSRLMDTRKTTPNFRLIEKWAVAIGGGLNHRMGLYDMVMLKDNHVDMAGGIRPAIESTKQYLERVGKKLNIEVETRSLDEVRQVLEVGGVDVIMLDNMSPADVRSAVQLIDGKCLTEASGGITETNLADIAACGVDYISVGALTHSAKSMDLSMKVKRVQ
jgi:nicotinate-nucleotide pyrophosphorylase (carboxylating)